MSMSSDIFRLIKLAAFHVWGFFRPTFVKLTFCFPFNVEIGPLENRFVHSTGGRTHRNGVL